MLVRDALIPTPLTVQPSATLLEFIHMILNSNQTNAVVVDNGILKGLLSASDVYRRLVPHYIAMDDRLAPAVHESYVEEQWEKFKHHRAHEVMVTELDTLPPDASIMQAVSLFVKQGRKTVPVVDEGSRYVGSVTRRSVLQLFAQRVGR
ncbi:MAG: CBS domain-containing protein [Planctomycetota bacterium]